MKEPAELMAVQRIVLADQDGQQGVVPERVVIQEILVAQTEPEDPLLEQIDERMFEEVGIAVVGEAPGEAFDEAKAIFNLFEQQSAAVGSDSPAIEPGHAFAPAARLKTPRPPATLCFHGTASFELRKRVFVNSLTSNGAVSVGNAVRNAAVREPQGVSASLSSGSFGHGGAFGTQGWIDPGKQRIFVRLISRQNFGNGDGAVIRGDFQRLAVEAIEK